MSDSIFDPLVDGREIRRLAKALSLEEIANCYGFYLNELSKEDTQFLLKMHSQGRAEAVMTAAETLFSRMQDQKSGGPLAIDYLTKFGAEWPDEGVAGTTNGISFKVLMDK